MKMRMYTFVTLLVLVSGLLTPVRGAAVTVYFNRDNTEMDIVSSVDPYEDIWNDSEKNVLFIRIVNPAVRESLQYKNMPVSSIDISDGVIRIKYETEFRKYSMITSRHVRLFFNKVSNKNNIHADSLDNMGIKVIREDGDWLYLESEKVQGWIRRDNLQGLLNEMVMDKKQPGNPPAVKPAEIVSKRDNVQFPESVSDRVLKEAESWIGTGYSALHDGEKGKSISNTGFVSKVFSKVNIILPKRAGQQFDFCEKIDVNHMKPGDLIFFSSKVDKNTPVHVGIFMGQKRFIHCYFRDGVNIQSYNDYWKNRIYGVGRVIK